MARRRLRRIAARRLAKENRWTCNNTKEGWNAKEIWQRVWCEPTGRLRLLKGAVPGVKRNLVAEARNREEIAEYLDPIPAPDQHEPAAMPPLDLERWNWYTPPFIEEDYYPDDFSLVGVGTTDDDDYDRDLPPW